MFMGADARRVAKPPPKKKKLKKKAPVFLRADVGSSVVYVEPVSPRAEAAVAADPDACAPTLGSSLRSTVRDTSAYIASPVAAVAESSSSPPPERHDFRSHSDDGCDVRASQASDADAAAAAAHNDATRVRASTANIIEQAALSGIEDFADAEERITAIVNRSQVSSSPGKRGGRVTEDDDVPKSAAASAQKAHMLPYLQRYVCVVPWICFPAAAADVCLCCSGRRPKLTPRGAAGEFGEVDWQLLYNESDGRVLTDLMSFNINDDAVAGSSKAPLLCKLLCVPKAFTAQVLRASASAHGLLTLDNCRQLMCSAFQKVLEREALLQHIHIKQGAGVPRCLAPLVLQAAIAPTCPQALPRTRTSCAWVASQPSWR